MAAGFNKVGCTVTRTTDEGVEQHHDMHVAVPAGTNVASMSRMGHNGETFDGVISCKVLSITTAQIRFENGDEWQVEWVPSNYKRGGCGCK